MGNVYTDAGATDVHITAINNTSADLSGNMDTCQIGIETDTGLLAHKDESDAYHTSAPKSTLTLGSIPKCKVAATGELEDASAADIEGTHTHDKLVASDGTPDPALSANAVGTITTVAGIIRKTTRVTTTPYNILATDHKIFVDSDGEEMTVNLPEGVNGTEYIIKNTGSAGNKVIIHPFGAETLFGTNADDYLYDAEDTAVEYETTEGWW